MHFLRLNVTRGGAKRICERLNLAICAVAEKEGTHGAMRGDLCGRWELLCAGRHGHKWFLDVNVANTRESIFPKMKEGGIKPPVQILLTTLAGDLDYSWPIPPSTFSSTPVM